MNTKDKIIELLKDHSQKSVIGWSVEEEDFNTLADELLKNFSLHAVVSCVCKIPEPRLKVSENGTYAY